jgi:hypothetical protein
MTTGRWLIGLAATLAAAAAPAAQGQPAAAPDAVRPFADCAGQKFEFKAGDVGRQTKISLCSKKDASKEDLVRMLDSAAAKIQELDKLPQERRTALIAQIKAKIIEIQATNFAAKPPMPAAPMPAATMPINSPPPATPMPARPLPIAAPLASKPRLTVHCFTPGEIGIGGPCMSLERYTWLIVQADEQLAAGTSLRFLRKGQVRGEIALAHMREGQSLRVSLPQQLCAGVASSQVEIQILNRAAGGAGANQVVDTLGPYQLRC